METKIASDSSLEDLRSANRTLVKLVEESPMIMTAWSDSVGYLAVSDPWLNLLHRGRTREEVHGRPVGWFHAPGDRASLEEALRRLEADREFVGETRVVDANGDERAFGVMARADVVPGVNVSVSISGFDLLDSLDRRDPAQTQATVVLACADPLARRFLWGALSGFDELELLASVPVDANLNSAVRGHRPDVVVVATSPFQGHDGSDGTSVAAAVADLAGYLEAHDLSSKVMVFDHGANADAARQLLAGGASGVLGSNVDPSSLGMAITNVASGLTYADPTLALEIVGSTRTPGDTLTDRERELARLIALGYTNPEIAAELFISVRTVENHRSMVKEKLGVETRREIVAWALRNRLIP